MIATKWWLMLHWPKLTLVFWLIAMVSSGQASTAAAVFGLGVTAWGLGVWVTATSIAQIVRLQEREINRLHRINQRIVRRARGED